MATQPKNAHLRQRIILALHAQEASSITELSGRMESAQPSVSRSLHALEAAGVVIRRKRRWFLSQRGIADAESIQQRLPSRAEEIVRQASKQQRLLNQTGRLAELGNSAYLESERRLRRQLEALSHDRFLSHDPFLKSIAATQDQIKRMPESPFDNTMREILRQQADQRQEISRVVRDTAEPLLRSLPLDEIQLAKEQIRSNAVPPAGYLPVDAGVRHLASGPPEL